MEVTVLQQSEKHRLVLEYAQPYGVLVETGLWNGQGATATAKEQRPELACYAIDIAEKNVIRVRLRGVAAWTGDSGVLLPRLLAPIERPACFWLDAHSATEGDDYLAAHPSPLLAELHAILAWPHADRSTVLVDDLRLLGAPGWPARSELAELDLGVRWHAEDADDILRLTPRKEN
jgi:hypothetical protein